MATYLSQAKSDKDSCYKFERVFKRGEQGVEISEQRAAESREHKGQSREQRAETERAEGRLRIDPGLHEN
jgi:hypothetical protein